MLHLILTLSLFILLLIIYLMLTRINFAVDQMYLKRKIYLAYHLWYNVDRFYQNINGKVRLIFLHVSFTNEKASK